MKDLGKIEIRIDELTKEQKLKVFKGFKRCGYIPFSCRTYSFDYLFTVTTSNGHKYTGRDVVRDSNNLITYEEFLKLTGMDKEIMKQSNKFTKEILEQSDLLVFEDGTKGLMLKHNMVMFFDGDRLDDVVSKRFKGYLCMTPTTIDIFAGFIVRAYKFNDHHNNSLKDSELHKCLIWERQEEKEVITLPNGDQYYADDLQAALSNIKKIN